MLDIRQSQQFANFMRDLGWHVEKIENHFVYLKHFPFIGNFAKILRPRPPFNINKINKFIKKNNVFRLKISPNILISENNYQIYLQKLLQNDFKIEKSPFNPTLTILIDLTQPQDLIFKNFTPAKRRAVRRALKNNLVVKQTSDIESFIRIRKKQFSPFGFLIENEMKMLWKNFYPDHALLLLAYSKFGNPLAGIFLLFYNQFAYYWYASSLTEGKKLFAPTLLVWETLKIAKKRGCKNFDFEGIYDDRFPKAAASWKGFSKFKEGFGGKKVILMENFKK